MAVYRIPILTNDGLALNAKVNAGLVKLEFTRFILSSTVVTLADLKTKKVSQIYSSGDALVGNVRIEEDNVIAVSGAVSNHLTSAGYRIRTVVLCAQDPDKGEIIYAGTTSYNIDSSDYISSNNGITANNYLVTFRIKVENTNNVLININPEVYANIEQINYLNEQVNAINGFIGLTEKGVLGVEVDFKNNKVTRLGEAKGLEGGSDFNQFNMFGGRKRIITTHDGIYLRDVNSNNLDITEGFILSKPIIGGNGVSYPVGTPVQVMVKQPAFWYRVVPLELKKIDYQDGFSIVRARYYISETYRKGFKLHPAFLSRDEKRKPLSHIYLSAFECCGYDKYGNQYAEGGSLPPTQDVALASVSGKDPTSNQDGLFTYTDIKNILSMTTSNFGEWIMEDIFIHSMNQLLFLIEYASFDTQEKIGVGLYAYYGHFLTGLTKHLINVTGESTGVEGKKAISYRGYENWYGNLGTYIDNIEKRTDNSHDLIYPYINYNNKAEDYQLVPFDLGYGPVYDDGFISAIGYHEDFDYLFLATEYEGSSSGLIPDLVVMEIEVSEIKKFITLDVPISVSSTEYGGGFAYTVAQETNFSSSFIGARIAFLPKHIKHELDEG